MQDKKPVSLEDRSDNMTDQQILQELAMVGLQQKMRQAANHEFRIRLSQMRLEAKKQLITRVQRYMAPVR